MRLKWGSTVQRDSVLAGHHDTTSGHCKLLHLVPDNVLCRQKHNTPFPDLPSKILVCVQSVGISNTMWPLPPAALVIQGVRHEDLVCSNSKVVREHKLWDLLLSRVIVLSVQTLLLLFFCQVRWLFIEFGKVCCLWLLACGFDSQDRCKMQATLSSQVSDFFFLWLEMSRDNSFDQLSCIFSRPSE